MRKNLSILLFSILLLVTGCSSDKTETKEIENTKEAKNESENITKENEESKTEVPGEVLSPGYTLNKREKVIFENESGKITYLGETIDEEGNLTAAIKQEGGTKSLDINIELKYIFADDSYIISRTFRDTKDYRYNPNDKILVLKCPYTAEGEPQKVIYRILNEIEGDTLINNNLDGFLKM